MPQRNKFSQLSDISDLYFAENGIWYSKHNIPSSISYPTEGNKNLQNVEDASYWFQHRNQIIWQALQKTGVRPSWLLDVGGGNGYVSEFLEKQGVPSVVLEPGEVGALNSVMKTVSGVINTSFENAHFKKDSVPAVGLFDVLEHFENDKALLGNIFQCLQPSGIVVIAVPAHKYLWSEADEFAGHFRRYTLDSLSSTLESVGYKCIFKSYFFSPLILPILVFRTLKTLIYKKTDSAKVAATDHGVEGGLAVKILKVILKLELILFKKFGKIPFGASVIAIGRKPNP